jgi:Spy/CpxP family protein refolding chaperone
VRITLGKVNAGNKLLLNMKTKVGAIICLCICATALLAQAQDEKKNGPSSPERRSDRFQGPGGYGPRMGGGFERVFGVLTEEQRTSFREAIEGDRQKVRELERKSSEARRELMEAALVDKFDEAKVREKLNALMKVDADLTMLRIKAISKIEPKLSAEQLEKLRSAAQLDGAGGPQAERRSRRPEPDRDENGLPKKAP